MALLASTPSRIALPSVTGPKLVQPTPPLVVYCQSPLLLTTSVTAMPAVARASTSLVWPAISVETSVPALPVSSSAIAVRSFAPLSTGASLTAVRLIVNSSAALSAMPSLTVKVRVRTAVSGDSLRLA